MIDFFKNFKEKVLTAAVETDKEEIREEKNVEYLISLGVLLWIVAQADDEFLPEEEEAICSVLQSYSDISDEDMPIILRTIKEAEVMRVDVHEFTRDIRKHLERDARIHIIDHLFRVACADKDLAQEEHEMIRKVSGLLGLDHKEFIASKIKIKREFGMDTVGL